MTDKTDSKERDAFEAWRSDLPYQGATQLQKEAFIAGFRAAIEQGGAGAAIAEIGSAAGEDAEFGQRAIYPLVDIDRFEYGTKLYARASLAANAGSEPVATIKSWTNGSYWRNYNVVFHRDDLPVGTDLYTHPSPPEGMVMVPREPTMAMRIAAKTADMDHTNLSDWMVCDWPEFKRIWDAMLKAAPPTSSADSRKGE